MRTTVVRRLCLRLRRPSSRRPLHAAAPSCRNRILVEADELRTDNSGRTRVTLGAGDARARHVTEVLRAEPGQRIRVGVVDGVRASALLTPGAGVDGSWALDWSAADEAPRWPAPSVDVLLALPCVPCASISRRCLLVLIHAPATAQATQGCATVVGAAGCDGRRRIVHYASSARGESLFRQRAR
jgi:hypothetical protein